MMKKRYFEEILIISEEDLLNFEIILGKVSQGFETILIKFYEKIEEILSFFRDLFFLLRVSQNSQNFLTFPTNLQINFRIFSHKFVSYFSQISTISYLILEFSFPPPHKKFPLNFPDFSLKILLIFLARTLEQPYSIVKQIFLHFIKKSQSFKQFYKIC